MPKFPVILAEPPDWPLLEYHVEPPGWPSIPSI